MLMVYVIFISFLGLFGFTENYYGIFSSSFSDNSNNNDDNSWLLCFITFFLGIILGFRFLFQHFEETRQPNDTTSNYGNEEYQSLNYLLNHDDDEEEKELHSDQLGPGFIPGDAQPAGDDSTTANNGGGGQGDGGCCAFCGDLSTRRCSRCKTARYWQVAVS